MAKRVLGLLLLRIGKAIVLAGLRLTDLQLYYVLWRRPEHTDRPEVHTGAWADAHEHELRYTAPGPEGIQ